MPRDGVPVLGPGQRPERQVPGFFDILVPLSFHGVAVERNYPILQQDKMSSRVRVWNHCDKVDSKGVARRTWEKSLVITTGYRWSA